jgi:DnaK suppressor protein
LKTLIDRNQIEDNIREVKMKDARGQATNKPELDEFRNTLKTRQAELSAGLRRREVLAIETSADELDQIQHAQDRDFSMGALDRESVRLREIRAALGRIDRGSFGICLNCEEEIGAKRLAAVPWTALCIACQEVAEQIANNSQDEQPFLSAA